MNYKSELTAVFGYPVAENPTVVMLEAAYNDLNLNWRYLTLEVKPENLKSAIEGAKVFGFKGFNLTIPHKIDIIKHLDEITPEAKLIGAVNTVKIVDDKLFGTNTDGKGFIKALEEEKINPSGKIFHVLGAGGAARAICVELALADADLIKISNRNAEKGLDLVNHINENTKGRAEFIGWDNQIDIESDIDILINATSIGLFPDDNYPNINYSTIKNGIAVCDVIPNPPNTYFLNQAKKQGAKTIDGLGMLVHQGVVGFELWTGESPNIEVMKKSLRDAFGV